jgi:hypothetical protein
LFGVILWTPEEVVGLYGVTAETIKIWIREKRIAGVRLGRKYYVTDTAIRRSVQQALQEAGLVRTPPRQKQRPAAVNNTVQSPDLFESVEQS